MHEDCRSGYCSFYSYHLTDDTRKAIRYCVDKATMVDGPQCALVNEYGVVHSVQNLGDSAFGTQAVEAPFGNLCSKEGRYYGCILIQGSSALWITSSGPVGTDSCQYCASDNDCSPLEFCDADRACKDARGRSEICDDGIDNNANGLIDAADEGCSSSPEGAVDSIDFGCANAAPGLSIDAWSFDPDELNTGVTDIHFYHKEPGDTSAGFGTYLGRTAKLPVYSKSDTAQDISQRFFKHEYASLLNTDQFGVSGVAAMAASVPTLLKQDGTVLHISAFAIDKNGDRHTEIPIAQEDGNYSTEDVAVIVGTCSGGIPDEGTACIQSAECSTIRSISLGGETSGFCSYGANNELDTGHCCPKKTGKGEVFWWDGSDCRNANLQSITCKASQAEITAAGGIDRVTKCPFDIRYEVKKFLYKLVNRNVNEIVLENRCVKPHRSEIIVNGLRSQYQACVYFDADSNPYGLDEGGFFWSDVLIYDPQY